MPGSQVLSRTTYTLRVPLGSERIDQLLLAVLRAEHPELSRAQLKTAFQEEKVLYQGRPVAASLLLPKGTHEVSLVDWRPAELEARAAPAAFLPVIHEDEGLLVLDKRSGVPSLPRTAEETETAVGSALAHYPPLREVGRGGLEPGLLHRLDTGTSGLLVFAKTQAEFDRLRAAWKTPEVRKIYRARVAGAPAAGPLKTPAMLTPWLGHDARSARRMLSLGASPSMHQLRKVRGKPLPTITHVSRMEPGSAAEGLPEHYDAEIEIETGVMHQIRCVLSSEGYPLLGDKLYGGPPASRLWLHAWRLRLPLPGGRELWLEAPLPW